jgi:hypothetical protein
MDPEELKEKTLILFYQRPLKKMIKIFLWRNHVAPPIFYILKRLYRVTPSPSLLSLKGVSRHPSDELTYVFQDAPTVRTEATITAA